MIWAALKCYRLLFANSYKKISEVKCWFMVSFCCAASFHATIMHPTTLCERIVRLFIPFFCLCYIKSVRLNKPTQHSETEVIKDERLLNYRGVDWWCARSDLINVFNLSFQSVNSNEWMQLAAVAAWFERYWNSITVLVPGKQIVTDSIKKFLRSSWCAVSK